MTIVLINPFIFSQWSPSNIATALWLDSSDATSIVLNSGSVSQWTDKSGGFINAAQSTAGLRPAYSATGLNQLPTIYFDGSKYLTLPTGFLFNFESFSVAMVLRGPLQQNDAIFGPLTRNQAGLEMVFTNVASFPTLLRVNGTNKITTGLWNTNNTASITSIVASNSATQGWMNGTSVNAVSGTGNSNLNFNGVYSIGTYDSNGSPGNSTGSSVAAEMYLSELVITASALSTLDRQKLEGYLAHKWSLASSLPAGHPYASTPPLVQA